MTENSSSGVIPMLLCSCLDTLVSKLEGAVLVSDLEPTVQENASKYNLPRWSSMSACALKGYIPVLNVHNNWKQAMAVQDQVHVEHHPKLPASTKQST